MITGHKPLELIFKNAGQDRALGSPPTAVGNDKYRPGSGNPADYMSRHPVPTMPSNKRNVVEEYVHFMSTHSVPKAMDLKEIERATQEDETLQSAKRLIVNGMKLTKPQLL